MKLLGDGTVFFKRVNARIMVSLRVGPNYLLKKISTFRAKPGCIDFRRKPILIG